MKFPPTTSISHLLLFNYEGEEFLIATEVFNIKKNGISTEDTCKATKTKNHI
jgi:hypothetical protein